MEQEKLYVIEEKTYEAHIEEEVHLYGLLHQLAFLAGKIKDRRDMENLIDTARRYGEIADQMFDRWSIPGRYLVFGDKADLARLKALELCELDAFYVEGEENMKRNCTASKRRSPRTTGRPARRCGPPGAPSM